MTASEQGLGPSWPEVRDAVASAARIDAEHVEPHTRLIDDLGLDSLSLTQLVAVLLVRYGADTVGGGLDQRAWDAVTAGDLHDACRQPA